MLISEEKKVVKTQHPLLDSFGRMHDYLRISIIERCNLRCQYCMPEEGVPLHEKSAILSFEEIEQIVQWLAEIGLKKIRITGGEPTIRKNLPTLFSRLHKIPTIETLAMTTNGILLADQLPELVENGLKQVNISLDTLDEMKFEQLTRRPGIDKVLKSIETAFQFERLEVKINTVAMKGINEPDILSMIDQFKSRRTELRIIEFMPFAGNEWSKEKWISKKDIQDYISSKYDLIPLGFQKNGTANRYQLKNYHMTIGFIASMSEPFCSSCNRIRLTADGMFKSCLFENSEIDLKTPLRKGANKEEFYTYISEAIQRKKVAHGGMNFIASHPGRPMISIGG